MKTNIFYKLLLVFFVALFTTIAISSCDKDDDGSDSGSGISVSGTWYATQESINHITLNKTDFQKIEEAIEKHDLLYTMYIDRNNTREYYAEKNMFVLDDGSFNTNNNLAGYLRNTITFHHSSVRIVNSNTLANCSISLYVDENMKENHTATYKKVASVYQGSIFKSVSAYVYYESYYTYAKSGNKIIVSNGDIYTVTDSGLIKDGSSDIMVKYDPTKIYVAK